MTNPAHVVLHFDDFALDTTSGTLRIAASDILLRPKTAAVLEQLLRQAGRPVLREALLDAVWPGISVTDDSLTQCISEIRRALGAAGPRLLRTLPRRGYMIVTTLHVAPAQMPPSLAPPALLPQPAALPRRPSLLAPAALAASLAALVIAAVALFEPGPAPVAAAPAISAPRQAQELIAEARARLSGPGAHEARISAAMPLFEQALALDPRSAEAASELAFGHANRVASRLSTDPAADLATAARFAERAMQLAPDAPIAQHAQAVVLRHQGRFAEALPLFASAGRDPDRMTARAGVGLMHLLLGRPEHAVPPLETLLLEAPEHPFVGTWRVYLGLARLMGGIGDHGAADFAAAAPRGTILSRPERLAHQLAALSLNGEAQAAARLRALLERLAPEMLAEPPGRFAMSQEPAYLARFEERVATPLRQWGWAGR